jgi:hypothetical protein
LSKPCSIMWFSSVLPHQSGPANIRKRVRREGNKTDVERNCVQHERGTKGQDTGREILRDRRRRDRQTQKDPPARMA